MLKTLIKCSNFVAGKKPFNFHEEHAASYLLRIYVDFIILDKKQIGSLFIDRRNYIGRLYVCFMKMNESDDGIPDFCDLSVLEDVSTGASIYSAGRQSAEFKFWTEFFKGSERLSDEFRKRVFRARKGVIWWDFLYPHDEKFSALSMKKQYRGALQYVKNCLNGVDERCSFPKTVENLKELDRLALDVIAIRKEKLEKKYKDVLDTEQRKARREIYEIWLDISDTIKSALSKLCISFIEE